MTLAPHETYLWPKKGQFWACQKPLSLMRVLDTETSGMDPETILLERWTPHANAEAVTYISFWNSNTYAFRHLWFEKKVPIKGFGLQFKTKLEMNVVPGDVILASTHIEYVPPPPPPPKPPLEGVSGMGGTVTITAGVGGYDLNSSVATISMKQRAGHHHLFFIGPETTNMEIQVLADWNPFLDASDYGIRIFQRGHSGRSDPPRTAFERLTDEE